MEIKTRCIDTDTDTPYNVLVIYIFSFMLYHCRTIADETVHDYHTAI